MALIISRRELERRLSDTLFVDTFLRHRVNRCTVQEMLSRVAFLMGPQHRDTVRTGAGFPVPSVGARRQHVQDLVRDLALSAATRLTSCTPINSCVLPLYGVSNSSSSGNSLSILFMYGSFGASSTFIVPFLPKLLQVWDVLGSRVLRQQRRRLAFLTVTTMGALARRPALGRDLDDQLSLERTIQYLSLSAYTRLPVRQARQRGSLLRTIFPVFKNMAQLGCFPILDLIELQLANCLQRTGFFSSPFFVERLCSHGGFLINGLKSTTAFSGLSRWDIVTFSDEIRDLVRLFWIRSLCPIILSTDLQQKISAPEMSFHGLNISLIRKRTPFFANGTGPNLALSHRFLLYVRSLGYKVFSYYGPTTRFVQVAFPSYMQFSLRLLSFVICSPVRVSDINMPFSLLGLVQSHLSHLPPL